MAHPTTAVSPAEMRRVCGHFPTGVTVVAGLLDGVPVGMAASSFTSVSLEPAMVSVCVGNTSSTASTLRKLNRWGVSVLGSAQEEIARTFGSRGTDRFAATSWWAHADGAVLIEGASAWLDCSVEALVPAGDHAIALLRVEELAADHTIEPLVFHASSYRRLAVE